MLVARQVFANFAEQFTAEGDTRLSDASQSRRRRRAGFTVTDAMVGEFKALLESKKIVDRRAGIREGPSRSSGP